MPPTVSEITIETQLTESQRIERSKDKKSLRYQKLIEGVRCKEVKVIERQNLILREMPDPKILAEEMLAAVMANNTEFPESKSTRDEIIRGLLFEKLVVIENDLFDLSKTGESDESSEEVYDDKLLVEFAHNAKRFGYDLGQFNGDIDFVREHAKGNISELFGVGDAKFSSLLNEHCYKQFKNFRRGLEKVANFLNHRTDTSEHGLPGFGVGGRQIEIADLNHFRQFLILSRNVKMNLGNIAEFIQKKTQGDEKNPGLNPEDFVKFEEMFIAGKIEIRNSVFSQDEVNNIKYEVMRRINSREEYHDE